jgi:lipopolysaccharide export system permease protein
LTTIRKLDVYIARTFLGPLALCVAGFAGLFVVVDLFANIDEFFGRRPVLEALSRAAVYYALRLPSLFARVMPLLTVVPAVICMVRLLRSNEICAMRASGVSERRILLPVLCCCGVVTVLAAVNQEVVVPSLHGALVRAERKAWCPGTPSSRKQSTPTRRDVSRVSM